MPMEPNVIIIQHPKQNKQEGIKRRTDGTIKQEQDLIVERMKISEPEKDRTMNNPSILVKLNDLFFYKPRDAIKKFTLKHKLEPIKIVIFLPVFYLFLNFFIFVNLSDMISFFIITSYNILLILVYIIRGFSVLFKSLLVQFFIHLTLCIICTPLFIIFMNFYFSVYEIRLPPLIYCFVSIIILFLCFFIKIYFILECKYFKVIFGIISILLTCCFIFLFVFYNFFFGNLIFLIIVILDLYLNFFLKIIYNEVYFIGDSLYIFFAVFFNYVATDLSNPETLLENERRLLLWINIELISKFNS